MTHSSPWLDNKKWTENKISSGANFVQYILWGFAIFWNLLSLPILLDYQGILEKAEREPMTFIAFLFPLIGLGLIFMALRSTLRWRRFGATPLILDPFPGSLGGHVGGCVDTNIAFNTGLKCAVSLSCIESYMSGSGKDRKRQESVIWQSDGFCSVASIARGSSFTFRFNVPDHLPESDLEQHNRYNLWRVSMHAELKGSDFIRGFVIPVFTTNGQLSRIRSGTEDHQATLASATQGVESVADVRSVSGGVQVWFAAFQRPTQGIVMLIIGLIFSSIGILIPRDEVPLIMILVFTGVGLLLLISGLFYLGKALLVEVTTKGINSRRFFFGVPISTKEISADDFNDFNIKQGVTMQSGNKTTVFYKIYAEGHSNKVLVAERLAGRSEAELLKECFETYLK